MASPVRVSPVKVMPDTPGCLVMNSPAEPAFVWWRLLNRYQWFVLIVASLGWLLDCMDQQLFNLARVPAMKELLAAGFGRPPTPAEVGEHGAYATRSPRSTKLG